MFTIFSVFYVLIAAAMIVLILMQRGDGANAGASFGGGASGTVFGARGAASFLTRTTAALATIFFILSLGMGMYLSHHGVAPSSKQTLGVMAGMGSSAPATSAAAASAPAAASAGHPEVPVAPVSSTPANPEVPAAPAKSSAPAGSAPSSGAPSSH
ncbi:MAG: preprotein translocase subunit SecG [Xanthomonadaceae bacterium]|nr:preprotein translocase subunit SecG [Xanthomonadaceae bacterium]MDE2270890.1 preprotein translocase subunit SecG [Xanthomonadaceae bacterium]